MTAVEDQLRRLFAEMEAEQAPIMLDEIVGGVAVQDRDAASESSPRRNWMLAAAVLVVLAVGWAFVLVAGVGDDPAPVGPVDSPAVTDGDGESEDNADVSRPLEVDEDAVGWVVGDVIVFGDGGQVRINSVRPDAEARNELYGPPDPGTTLTEIEVEYCVGTNSSAGPTVTEDPTLPFWMGQVDRDGYLSHWTGVLDDGDDVPARRSYWLPYEGVPGGCARGYISVVVPDGAELVEVVLSNYVQRGEVAELVDSSRWDVTRARGSGPVEDPLRPPTPPDSVAVGEPMDLAPDWKGFEATVLEVIENPTPKPTVIDLLNGTPPQPPAAGRKLVEIRAQVCKLVSGNYLLEELQWLIATADNYIGTSSGEIFSGFGLGPQTDPLDPSVDYSSSLVFDDLEVGRADAASGECLDGYVQIQLSADATPVDVIVASQGGGWEFKELARTRLDS